MARPLRVEYPGAFYHVINRGNAGENLFKSGRDIEKFLEYLEKARERFALVIHTYCVMNNHYHLLAETPQPNLSQAIQWLNGSYAIYFNRKYRRPGHLFQGRFRAILINADEYLGPLSRYIHLNPVRAGVVLAPDKYPWSSYRALTGKAESPGFLETDWLLSNFGRKKKEAMRRYKAFVEGVDARKLENPHRHATGGFVLGGEDFVKWVRETFLFRRENEKEIPQLRKLKTRVTPGEVVQEVCREFGCSEEQVLAKGRKKNVPREVAIYLTRELSGFACKNLGALFGGVSGALITMMSNRIAEEKAWNHKLESQVERIKRRIFNI